MNPKIARDPYLRALAERHGTGAVEEAGYFDDGDPGDAPLDDLDRLGTPTARLRCGLAGAGADHAGPPVVLLATGGFHPVHDGHLGMMRRARAAATAAGWWVVGGYLSPGHDAYITHKCGSADPGASDRIAAAVAATSASDWLDVDPWEATARRVAVNFTDVTARLEAWLRAHVDAGIEVAYVCGADNARFALAFAARGRCIVVGRPGSEGEGARWRNDLRVAGNPHILWADGTDRSASSTLRPVPRRPVTRLLRARCEDERVVATIGLDPARWRRFQHGLLGLFEESFERTTTRTITASRVSSPLGATISLDPFVTGDADLAVSRLFDLGGHRLLGHVARPGRPPLEEQLAALPTGDVVLVDDDRATGSTIAFVESMLCGTRTVRSVEVEVDERTDGAHTEIADTRDFLVGTDHGGLVVALPDGTVGRAPYVFPFVDPSARASIPSTAAVAFSRDVWGLAADAYRDTDRRVAELPDYSARTLRCAGFAPDRRVEEVCRHYARRCADVLPLG